MVRYYIPSLIRGMLAFLLLTMYRALLYSVFLRGVECSEPHIRYVKIIESNYILYRRLFLGTLCIFPLGTLYPSADNIERPKDVD